MKEYVFRRIKSAICSVRDTTDLTIKYGGVACNLRRRNSIYVSRREVSFSEDDSLTRFIHFSSRTHHLILGEGDFPPIPGTYAMEWEGGAIPRSLLEPILTVAQGVGMNPEFLGDRLIPAYVPVHRLAGYYSYRPIYLLAHTVEGDIEPIRVQGHLSVYPASAMDLPLWEYDPHWCSGGVFFNHRIHFDADAEPEHVSPLGVVVEGQVLFGIKVTAHEQEIKITSPDHETILLQAGEYVMLHPRPEAD